MRPLPLLGLVVGLAMLGWGGWSLYARFAGPDVYWGPEKVAFLDELGRTLDEMRAIVQKEREEVVDLREQFARLKGGAEKDATGKRLDETTADLSLHEKSIDDFEHLHGATVTHREDAKGRALRRGILFTLLGLVWSARAGAAVFAPARRAAATAAPAPSPPSPRPAD
jgi:hypothetical protein